jgi:hypothetical protein
MGLCLDGGTSPAHQSLHHLVKNPAPIRRRCHSHSHHPPPRSSRTSQTLAMAWRGAASRTVLAAVRRSAPVPAAARLRAPAPFAAPRRRVLPAFSPAVAAR